MAKDDIYALPLSNVGDFAFDERVVDVFPDMIARSVPGYTSILSMIGELAARYSVSGTRIYDLGCSLGAATLIMRQRAAENCEIYAVDSSPAMIGRLTEILAAETIDEVCSVHVAEADINDIEISDASFVVLNFTLQFIPADQRRSLLEKISCGMRPGGAIVISEKICFDDPADQRVLTDLHHTFKSAHGYSDLEIAQKRTSLENTLIPETVQQQIERLRSVGFSSAVQWFQCFNFTSILAIK